MLQILVDTRIEDKNRDSFIRAVQKECERQKKYCVIKHINTHDESLKHTKVKLPTLVAQPYGFKINDNYNDADNNATARVILDITKNYTQGDVLVINRSELIGKALVSGLLDQNHTPLIAHSKTNQYTLETFCKNADIIISATGHNMGGLSVGMAECVIDVSNDFGNKFDREYTDYYSMSTIGKLTVKKIVDEIS